MTNEEIIKEQKASCGIAQINAFTNDAIERFIVQCMNKAREDERISMTQCRRTLRRRASKKITIYIR